MVPTDPASGLAEPLPKRIGPYEIRGVLGRGGMGVVYDAAHTSGHPVALKVLRSVEMQTRAEQVRFEREAKIRIEHPNVVDVLDAGVNLGVPYIALERLEGEVLQTRLARAKLSAAEALDIAIQAARGLEAAHQANVIHRDLKPGNLFLCADGTLKIIDFGIAHLHGQETRLTMTGNVLGTPAYLSPEQAHGHSQIDARTDIWSLGIVLYEILAGRTPFERNSGLATMLAVMIEPAPPLGVLVPTVPPSLAHTIGRCLEKDPSRRFPDAASLLAALLAIDLSEVGEVSSHTLPAQTQVDATSPALSVPHVISMTPGENRLVAVLLAEAVSDVASLRDAVESRGGVLLSVLGDRAIGIFGGEALEGDEAGRAAAAALEARAAASWISVASGRASYSGETGIAGAVLVAAEQACAAHVEGVAITLETADVLTSRYTLRSVGDRLFEIAVSGAASDEDSVFPLPIRLATVGRESELAQLRTAIATVASERRPVVTLVVGSPGIGKSHLRWEVERLLETASEPFLALSGRCEPGRGQSAFSLWETVLRAHATYGAERLGWPSIHHTASVEQRRAAVRELAREAFGPTDRAEESALFLGELLRVPMHATAELEAARHDPQLMQDRLRLAITDWLQAFCERSAVALLLEDIHWSDELSLSVLEELVGRLAQVPLLLFATARPQLEHDHPEFLSGESPVLIRPANLSVSQVEELAQAVLGRPLSDGAVRALADRTAGNPFFVEQIVLALGQDEDVERIPLPITVEAAVQSRLDHLPSSEKELCKRASVLDRPFVGDDLRPLDVYDPKPVLTSLVRRDLLVSRLKMQPVRDREYHFRSSLVRDVAYGLLADVVRRELHAKLAEYLEKSPNSDPEQVAVHFERASRSDLAARWYELAVASASTRGDAPRVLRCAEKALAAADEVENPFALHMARSEAYELLGRLTEQEEALLAAQKIAQSDADLARALTDGAVWLWRNGQTESALSMIVQAVGIARSSADPEVLATARGREATLLSYLGQPGRASEAFEEAKALSEEDVPTMAPLIAAWGAQLATAQGDLAKRESAYREALRLYEAAGDLRRAAGAETNLADGYNRMGAYEEAEHSLKDAIVRCQRLGNRLIEGYALTNLGYALIRQERNEEALAALDQASELADKVGDRRLSLCIAIYRARASLAVRPEDAVRDADEAATEAGSRGWDGLRVMALTVSASAELGRGRPEEALLGSSEAMELRDRIGGVEEDEAELFLVHAMALEEAGRSKDGEETRKRGRARLQSIADRIVDEGYRHRFLKDVEAHRKLLQLPTDA